MSIFKIVEVVTLTQQIVDVIEDIYGNELYIVAETCSKEANEDLAIFSEEYPLHGCELCNYSVGRAIKDCYNYGSFRCQNCGNFKEFLYEVEE